MTLFAVCGYVLLACALALVIKQFSPAWGKMVAVGAGVILTVILVEKLGSLWSQMMGEVGWSGQSALFKTLAKTMGVAFLVETVSDICRDLGQETIADRLIFFGKTEILLLSLPLVKELLTLASEVVG